MLQSATTFMVHCNVVQNLDARAVYCIRVQFAQLGVVSCFVVKVHNAVRDRVRLGFDIFYPFQPMPECFRLPKPLWYIAM